MMTDNIGHQMHRLVAELHPICRNITGNGFRETLKVIRRHIPPEAHEVPTGTKVFDWALNHPDELREMGQRGREAAVKHLDRPISVGKFRTMIDALRSQGGEFVAENRRDAANQIAY